MMTTATAGTHRLGPIEAIPPGEGREYRVQGEGVAVFRTRSGEAFTSDCPRLKTYPVVVEADGEIVLCVEEVDQGHPCLG